jgi:predicted membrane protein
MEGILTKGGFSEKLLVVCLYFEVTELMASSLFIVFSAIIFWDIYLVAKYSFISCLISSASRDDVLHI